MSLALISAQKVSRSFGGKPLFENLTIAIADGERLALIGPNGSGKSTLMRILVGLEDSDSGEVARRRGIRIGFVEQQPRLPDEHSVLQVLTEAATQGPGPEHEQQGRLHRIQTELAFTNLEQTVKQLSGGWKKRLAIAVEILKEPDLLLLDEPTNHLDIDGILWLESFLEKREQAVCFISHDRYFIERLSTRVVEIDRRYPSGTFEMRGAYSDFVIGRSEFLAQLQRSERNLENKVRREVEWLRQGAKARTTKSKHRSAEAHRLLDELNASDLKERQARFSIAASGRETRELIKVVDAGKSIDGKQLFKGVNLILSPGVRLGVIGPNGSGKTTFIKTLLGLVPPDEGRVIRAPNLKIAFFDQERKALDPNQTLQKALCDEGDAVVFQGRSVHVASWAKRFLFRIDQLALPVGSLSGGEQARVLLARLVRQEADVLFFDEPTNDIDIQTLEVLEESFIDFPGAIVLVTHDRYFMDRTATTVLGLGGNGPTPCFADYSQWEIAREELREQQSTKKNVATRSTQAEEQERKKELQALERKIDKEEKKLAALKEALLDPKIASDHGKLAEAAIAVTTQEAALQALVDRWEVLA